LNGVRWPLVYDGRESQYNEPVGACRARGVVCCSPAAAAAAAASAGVVCNLSFRLAIAITDVISHWACPSVRMRPVLPSLFSRRALPPPMVLLR